MSLQHPGIRKQHSFHQNVQCVKDCHLLKRRGKSSRNASNVLLTASLQSHDASGPYGVHSIFKNLGLEFAPQIHNSAVHLPQPRPRCQMNLVGKVVFGPPRYRVPGVSCPSWQFWRHSLHPWCSAVTVVQRKLGGLYAI